MTMIVGAESRINIPLTPLAQRLNNQTISHKNHKGELCTLSFGDSVEYDREGNFLSENIIYGGFSGILRAVYTNGHAPRSVAFKMATADARLSLWKKCFGDALTPLSDNDNKHVGYAIDLDKVASPLDPQSIEIFEDEQALRLIAREARIQRDLKHPNICQSETTAYLVKELYSGADDGFYSPALVTEFIEGRPLNAIKHLIPPHARAPYLKSMVDVADAVDYTNAKGYCNRDIKPENIMWDQDKQAFRVIDFGMAVAGTNTQTASEGLKGTLDYMPPEMFVPSLTFGDLPLSYIQKAIDRGFIDGNDSKVTSATDQSLYAASYSSFICVPQRGSLLRPRSESMFEDMSHPHWQSVLHEDQLADIEGIDMLDLPDNYSDNEKRRILRYHYIPLTKDPTMRLMTTKVFASIITSMLIKDGWEDRPIPYETSCLLADHAFKVRYDANYQNANTYREKRGKLFIKLLNTDIDKLADYILPTTQPGQENIARDQLLRTLGLNEEAIREFDIIDKSTKAEVVIRMMESSFNGRRQFPKHSPVVYKRSN